MMILKVKYWRYEVGTLKRLEIEEYVYTTSLEEAYDYFKNKRHLNVLSIDIINYTNIPETIKKEKSSV